MSDLFTEEDLAIVAPVLVADAGHLEHGAFMVDDGDVLVCACGKPLFRLEAVS